MKNKGFKQRLKTALDNSEKIKILFQYPHMDRVIIKVGNVLAINSDSFDFRDRFDGDLTFGYGFIIEIGAWRE
jgi:hypothetical protein